MAEPQRAVKTRWVGKQAPRASLNRQSCNRDYNSRKERAGAAEHQNIVDHGIPPVMLGATVVQRRPACNHLSATGLGQS